MRPRGRVRQALAEAARQLVAERIGAPVRGGTWREMALLARDGVAAGVAFEHARRTVANMVRAGELVPVGQLQVPWSRRSMVAYAPAESHSTSAGERCAALTQVLRGWQQR